MAEMIELKEQEERVILVAVSTGEDDDTAASVDELEELASTAGAVTVGKVIQNRENVHPGTYLGKGKIEEVKELLWELDATGIICDDELSPAQLKNLEDALDTKVMDRTMVTWIFRSRPEPGRERSRWSWPSSGTGPCAWWGSEIPCPVWEEGSAPGDRERRSWRWTGV